MGSGSERSRRAVATSAAVALLVLAACSQDEPDMAADAAPIGGEPEEPVEDAPVEGDSDPAETDEPFPIPDEIDEAYAEDVVNAILEINHEVFVTAFQQSPGEVLDVAAVDMIHATAEGNRREALMEQLQGYIDAPDSTDGYLPVGEMEPTKFEVEAVLHAEPDNCILAVGWWDRRGFAVDPPSRERQTMFSLSRLDRNITDIVRNPTPWKVRHISPMRAGGEPIPKEQWSDINFGDALDRTCEDR